MSSESDELEADADALRAAFASALLGPRDMVACPPADAVWDAIHGAVTPEERQRIVDHIAVCPMCAEAWRLAVRGTPDPTPDRR
ncbi:MAG: hypothetical protein KC621_03495 [Myxococcales bacterium]|nr:hypothetical protein [Myxococcales bacterium]